MATGGRLEHIDGLRGIAALVVVFQHAAQFVHEAGRSEFDWLLDNVNLGRFGVVLFFLISGCVVPFSFKGGQPLRNFAISRFFRLYPVYWLSIPVLTYLALQRGQSVGPGTVLGNLTMVQGFWGGSHIGPGYWTLSYEMAFYLLCAFLFWRGLMKDAKALGVLATAMLCAALWPVASLGDGPVSQAPYFIALFLLGTILRMAFVDLDPVAGRIARWLVPLTLVAGAGLSGWIRQGPYLPGPGAYFTPLSLGAAMTLPVLLFVLALLRPIRPPRWLCYLGAISYSVYLFQDIGLCLLPRLVSLHDHPFLYVLLVLAVTIAIAAVIHRIVEQPMIALGRRFTHRPARSEQELALS